MKNDTERKVMSIYRASAPSAYVGEASGINHLPWTMLVIALGLIFWLVIALSNAENQRYALASKVCQDRVFPAEIDTRCLVSVRTREHWWQHVLYAMGHLRA